MNDLPSYGALPATFAVFTPVSLPQPSTVQSGAQSLTGNIASNVGPAHIQQFAVFLPHADRTTDSVPGDTVISVPITPVPASATEYQAPESDGSTILQSAANTSSQVVAPSSFFIPTPTGETPASPLMTAPVAADVAPLLEAAKLTMANLGDVITALQTQIATGTGGVAGAADSLLSATAEATQALQGSADAVANLVDTVPASLPPLPVVAPLVTDAAALVGDLPVVGDDPATGFAILANLLSAADVFALQESVPAVGDVMATTGVLELADALAGDLPTVPLLGIVSNDDGGLLGSLIGNPDPGLGLI